MKIIEFIISHWSDILLLILGVAALIYAIYKKDLPFVRQQLFSLVTEAEKAYGGGTGVLKLASVVSAIYPQLPKLFRMLITEKMLVRIIESVLAEAKKKWTSNKKLLEESEDTE
jgi:hypothetical protein